MNRENLRFIGEFTRLLKNSKYLRRAAMAGGFVIAALVLWQVSQAATFAVQEEAEAGSASGNVAVLASQAGASGGGAVRFGGVQSTTTVNDSMTGTGTNQFNYSGAWTVGANAGTYQGDDHYSGTAGDIATVAFSGTQIKYYGSKAAHHGIAAVSVDNGSETSVDLYSATRADQSLLYASPVLANGNHTLKIRVAGDKNASSAGTIVTVDKVDIVSDGGASTPPPPPPAPGTMPAITSSGGKLMRNGTPWWFLGYNSFTWSGNCGAAMSAADVDAWLGSMRHDGHGMVRIFFFQGWSLDRLDQAVAAAKKNNVYILLSIDNAYGGCGRGPWQTAWFDDASIMNPYKDHFKMLLQRYKGETAFAGFEYFNEPSFYDGKLKAMYDEMDGVRDSIDPGRLMSSGTVASYWLGNDANFQTIQSSPGVDIASVHEYDWDEAESHWATNALPLSAGKPLLIGEFGAINWNTECGGKSATALARVKAKAAAYATADTRFAGGLAWAWEPNNSSCYGLDDDQDIQAVMRTYVP